MKDALKPRRESDRRAKGGPWATLASPADRGSLGLGLRYPVADARLSQNASEAPCELGSRSSRQTDSYRQGGSGLEAPVDGRDEDGTLLRIGRCPLAHAHYLSEPRAPSV